MPSAQRPEQAEKCFAFKSSFLNWKTLKDFVFPCCTGRSILTSISFVAKPHIADASEWWCGVWKRSPGKVLELRSVTVLIRVVNLITLRVLTHIFTLKTSVQIPFFCLLCTDVPGWTGSPPTVAASLPLSPPEAGGHLASSKLLLKPCGSLLAASFSQFKASSLTMCTTKATVCHCLPLGGKPSFWGWASVSSAAWGEPAPPWPLLALEGSVERHRLSAPQGREHLAYRLWLTMLLAALLKRIKSVGNSLILEGKVCSLLKWRFGLRTPPWPWERGSHGSGLQ